jgi:hypothetical protein
MFTRYLTMVLAFTVSFLATPGWCGCPGDLNGDGVVLVDEVLTMVGEALSGCPAQPAICPGGRDVDGVVSVAEILTAVNALLTGCPSEPTPTVTPPAPTDTPMPSQTATASATGTATITATPSRTPTPASCPFTFDDDTLSQNILCNFIGPFTSDPTCPSDLEALFSSDGSSTVGVAIGTAPDVVMFVGEKVSSTQANLTGYTVGQELVPSPLSGKIELQQGGRILVIAPDSSPFALGLDQQICNFDQYSGTFIGVLGGQSSPAPGRATSARLVASAAGPHLLR